MVSSKNESKSKKEHMNILIRKNRGKKALEKLGNIILKSTNITDLYFTTLEERDILWESFCTLYKNEKARQIFKIEDQDENRKIVQIFNQLVRSNEKFSGYVFFNQFKDIGALKIDTPLFFKNAAALLNIDGDSLCILDVDLGNGILVDHYESDDGSGWTYEFIILGRKWSHAFYSLTSKVQKESSALDDNAVH
jgi:hypothetical protein